MLHGDHPVPSYLFSQHCTVLSFYLWKTYFLVFYSFNAVLNLPFFVVALVSFGDFYAHVLVCIFLVK